MFLKAISFTKLAFLLSKLLHQLLRTSNTHENFNSFAAVSQFGFQKFHYLTLRQDLENHVLVFHAETVLLRSPSLFPYFMLVAFEAGGPIRALILSLLYPLIMIVCNVRKDLALRMMAMVAFFGLSEAKFNEGRAVLPKFFMEDVGREGFEVLRRGKVTVAVSDLPRVMVEYFLRDYLCVDYVVGREMRVVGGYFVGVMEERYSLGDCDAVRVVKEVSSNSVVGVGGCFRKCCDCEWFSNCKDIYLVSEQERRNWNPLPRDLYPKPLIFHDGRLAFRPTFLATLAMFMWLPLGLTLAITRIIIVFTLPSNIVIFFMHLSGIQLKVLFPNNFVSQLQERGRNKANGVLFVCNHKTLLDPLLIFYCLKTPLAAVVYSLSRMSEIISPIKTVRLTRDREKDAELMHTMLSRGNLVVCPEGTTCREPYLLRFSPLFTEICDEIYPVAVDCHVSMFHGSTARGYKSLDPLFFTMNPWPRCSVHFLNAVRCGPDESGDDSESSKYKRANSVQGLIGKELGFGCTRLTRRDKYLILAGNEGIVKDGKKRDFLFSFLLLWQIVVTWLL